MADENTPAETPPAGNATRLAFRADAKIDDNPVAIEGMMGGDFFLQLNQPAKLGTPVSFAYWLKKNYAVDVDVMLPYDTEAEFKKEYANYKSLESDQKTGSEFEGAIKTKLGSLPESAREMVTTAMLAEITIEDLYISSKAKTEKSESEFRMKFGLSVDFGAKPLALLPAIDITKLTFMIMNFPEEDASKPGFGFPERVALPVGDLLEDEPTEKDETPAVASGKATGQITFATAPGEGGTVTFGGDIWTFKTAPEEGDLKTARIEDGDLKKTLEALVGLLNKADGETGKCRYSCNAEGTVLTITCKTAGLSGNDFAIAADTKSKGKASGKKLTGGTDA